MINMNTYKKALDLNRTPKEIATLYVAEFGGWLGCGDSAVAMKGTTVVYGEPQNQPITPLGMPTGIELHDLVCEVARAHRTYMAEREEMILGLRDLILACELHNMYPALELLHQVEILLLIK